MSIIDDRLHCVNPDGSLTKSVPAEVLTFEHCQAILGTTQVIILRAGVITHPHKYQNHSILIVERGNSTKNIDMSIPVNTALIDLDITDIVVRGHVIIGPSWCFEQLENMGAA